MEENEYAEGGIVSEDIISIETLSAKFDNLSGIIY